MKKVSCSARSTRIETRGNRIRAALLALGITAISQTSMAAGVTYLSCPSLDERAKDLTVVIDQPNGTASLQTETGGRGLNFTSPASFGPGKVEWQGRSKEYPQKFSVDRVSLVLTRETKSRLTGKVYLEKSPCSMHEPPRNAKF